MDWALFEEDDEIAGAEAPPSCCGDVLVHENDGTLVCSGCGMICASLIDKQQDQSSALAEGSGISHYLPKSSLGTSISGSRWMKLRQVNSWWKWIYKEKSFFDDKKLIESLCSKASLSQAVVDNSLILFKRASMLKKEENGRYVIIRGNNRRAIMAAAVYYGARLQRQPLTPREVADLFDMEITQINKGCKRFQTMVDLSDLIRFTEKCEAHDYVHSFCHRTNMNREVTEAALRVVRNIELLQLATHHQPLSVAAVSLLIVDPKGRSRAELSRSFKVSENTIQKTLKEVYPFSRILVNDNLTAEYLKDMMMDDANVEVDGGSDRGDSGGCGVVGGAPRDQT